eukprot:11191202-Lingulodinium_polyedra.AAC.1
MDWEAFSVDAFSGAAKRSSRRILASEAACHKDWIFASLDIDKAFLRGSLMQNSPRPRANGNGLSVSHCHQAAPVSS